MTYAKRYFTQVKPVTNNGPQPSGEINNFFEYHVFVVLGDPGMGKTTSFELASKTEPDAEFIRIGEFLSSPNLEYLLGKTLYLDGLDEHRSRANGIDVIDAIIGRLKELNSPKIRISCRTAEWHGGKDLDALSAVNNGGPVVQLELQPLSNEDILNLIPDSTNFVNGAYENGLEGFLSNPQDFNLLYEFYIEKNQWPKNRSELMDGACKALLKELNKRHYEAVDDWVTDRELTRASDYLGAILMLSNISGISSDRTTANKAFPSIHEFDGNLYSMKAATGRHVFKAAEKKRIEPRHRKIAEYMAARYLATRVREGLSLRRVMALMTGIDGGTPPDLRGVYAWLVTLLSGMADNVLVHDPYGAIIYGDAWSWSPNTKKSALNALRVLAKKDPWFRLQDRSRSSLGGLSDPALVGDFKYILSSDESEPHLMGVVLDAIAGGSSLPEIGDFLLEFIRNKNKPEYLKDEAIDAFITACPNRNSDLLFLLEEINDGSVHDSDQNLRGTLLKYLYPNKVGPDQVLRYLEKPSEHYIGVYHMFVHYGFFEKSDDNGLRLLAKSLNEKNIFGDKGDEYDDTKFVSKLIVQLINGIGKEVLIKELYSWLVLGLSKYETSRIRGDEAKVIQQFLENNDQIYIDLFFYFFNARWPGKKNWYQIWWRFRSLVIDASPPFVFPLALLKQLDSENNIEKASALYELATILVMNEEPGLSSVTLDELWVISERNSKYAEVLERSSKCSVEEWRQDDVKRKKQRKEERKTRQEKNIKNLASHKESIESGEDLRVLEHYALVWFDKFSDIDHEAKPKERLTQEVGKELAESILIGFKNSLSQSYFHTVEDIAETDANSKSYHRGYLMLAAMDVITTTEMDSILNLPDDTLKMAIAYKMASHMEEDQCWSQYLLDKKLNLYTGALNEYWRAQLAKKPEQITNFYLFSDDDPILPAVVKILPGLLKVFPRTSFQLLTVMLLNAIRFCTPLEGLLPIIRNALRGRFKADSGQRMLWISAGFSIDQVEYLDRFKDELQKNDREKWSARSILMEDILKRGKDGKFIKNIKYRKLITELLGSVINNVSFEYSKKVRRIGKNDEPTAAHEIRKLIHAFAEEPSDDAAKALAEIESYSSLSHWHRDILFTIANQVRTAREAWYTYPDVSQVVSTLSNEEPANVADLKALVVDALKEVADEIRHGNTDGYKSFWNIGKYSKATDIHVDENTARDRLLELLRPKLRHLDIIAEPEVSYADDKRADIAIYSHGMKLPIEIKRDDHNKIWEAAENQLQKQYARDPASEGNGIYLVFWFDGKGMKCHPKGIKKPVDSISLKEALELTVPESSSGLIDVCVIDASVPVDKQEAENIKYRKKKAVTKKVAKKAIKKANL